MANCANCGKDLAFFNGGKNAVIKTMGGWGAQHLRFCSNRCIDEYQAREDAKHAAKVAKKEAKKAAKQAAREEGEYESEGGSSSSGELPSGCVKIVGMILAFLVVCGILGMLFCKNEDPNDPAVKMAKWEEHLEKRRAAFAEGLPEEGVEARGLKNYTWEEWQTLQKKGQAKASEKPAEKVEDIAEKWHEHHKKRREFINSGHTKEEAEAAGFKNYTLDEFKQNYKNIKYKTLEEIRQSAAVPTTPAAVPEKSATPVDAADRAKAAAEARAKAEDDAKAKREAAIKEKMETRARMKAEAEAKAKAKADAEAKARAKAQAAAKARAEAAAKAEAEARAKAEAEAKAKKDAAKVAAVDAVGEQQNGADRKKASADSKGIAITVQGKGKTKDAALRYAIRQAVWKTVGTWVGSKSRMEEKRDEVKAQVMTITQDDVRKFEVLDTQQEGGSFVLKVKVHVSKKQIAPKFAKVFPDVFGND